MGPENAIALFAMGSCELSGSSSEVSLVLNEEPSAAISVVPCVYTRLPLASARTPW
jgi:hypothetical protein